MLLCHMMIGVCEEPLGVFLFLGDESILGKDREFDELSEHLKYEQKNLVYHKGQWVPISPEYIKSSGLGPEVVFAHQISTNKGYRYSDNVGIIKLAQKGSSLDHHWSPDSTASDALYPQLIKLVQEAKAKREIKILGVLWSQGLADSKSPEMTKHYQANLEKFVTRIRKDMDSPEAIFVTARMDKDSSPWDDDPPLTVALSQENAKLDRYRYIESHGHCVDAALTIHGALVIGRSFVDKMIAEMTFEGYAPDLSKIKYIVRAKETYFNGFIRVQEPHWLKVKQSKEEIALEAFAYNLIQVIEKPTKISTKLKKELSRITASSDDKASENFFPGPFSANPLGTYMCLDSDKAPIIIITNWWNETLFCNYGLIAGDSVYQKLKEWESVICSNGLIEMIEAELPEEKTTLSPFQKWKSEKE